MHQLIKKAYDEIDQGMKLLDKHADMIVQMAAILPNASLQHNAHYITSVGHLRTDSILDAGELTAAIATAGYVSMGESLERVAHLHFKHESHADLHLYLVVEEATPGSLFAVEDGKTRWLSFDEIDARMDDEAEQALTADATAATSSKVEEGREYHEDGTVVINHTDGSCEEFPPSCRHLVPA